MKKGQPWLTMTTWSKTLNSITNASIWRPSFWCHPVGPFLEVCMSLLALAKFVRQLSNSEASVPSCSFQTHRSDHLKSTRLVVDRFLRQTVTLFFTCNSSIVELWFSREVLLTGGSFASQSRHFNVLDLLSIHLDVSPCVSISIISHESSIQLSTYCYGHQEHYRYRSESGRLLMFFDQCVAFQHVVSKIKGK